MKNIKILYFAILTVFVCLIATVTDESFAVAISVIPVVAGLKNYKELINKVGTGKRGGEMLDIMQGHDPFGDSPASLFIRNFANSRTHRDLRNTIEARVIKYSRELIPYLHPDNSFIKKSINDAEFAASGFQKDTANQAVGPVGTKGRFYPLALAHGASAPEQTVKIRKNDFLSWLIEYFSTNPDAITRELTSEVAYDARQDLLQSHANVINDMITNFTAVEWAQGTIGAPETIVTTGLSTQYVFTSSATARANSVPGTSNTVKKITKADFMAVKSAFYKQNILSQGGSIWYLPTVDQYNDLLEIAEFTSYEQIAQPKLVLGIVGVIMGINVLNPRYRTDWGGNSVLYTYTAGAGTADLTLIEDTASPAVGMVGAGLIWVDKQVKRAEGSVIVFPWQNSPIYMGDVYASEARYGAQRKRKDDNGVVMLVETPV